MNIEEIISSLSDMFNQPLSGGEKRKIIYWIDRENAWLDSFDEVIIDNVKNHILTDKNYFYTKYLLEEEDTTSHFLIYTTELADIDEDNCLSDNILYSKMFYADEASIIMRDLKIPEPCRKVVSDNKKFFRNKDRYARFKNYNIDNYSDELIEEAIISVICRENQPSIELSLRTILMESLSDDNKYLKNINSFFDINRFWFHISKNYGYINLDRSLKKLLMHLMITTLSYTINPKKIDNYKEYIGKTSRSNCLLFIDRWMNHKTDYEIYNKYANEIEEEIMFNLILEELNIEDIKETEIFASIDRKIIKYIVEELENNYENYSLYIDLIENRKRRHFYEVYKYIYEALLYTVKLFEFKKNRGGNIGLASPDEMINEYTNNYYKMDYYYRKFYVAYDKDSSKEIMKKLKIMAEDLYTNWYMVSLGNNWTDSLGDNENWDIKGCLQQKEFYNSKILPHVKTNEKVFVIISDALRYEVAIELNERLTVESLGNVSIEPMISGLPSSTKFGMASLLPHKKLELKDDDFVYVDDINTGTIVGRGKVLKSYEKESVAIDYNKFVNMNRSELREFSKGKKIIYIYHDSIDAIGDKAATEIYAFDGAEKALNEISELIKIISDGLSGTNIYITADHGFIYQRDDLEEVDKIAKEKIEYVESKRRYALSKEDRNITGLFKFKMDNVYKNDDLNIYIPKGNIRFKTQGAGAKFVHGGASLQEIVVPVITYRNKRSGQKGVVTPTKTSIKLTNAIRKITNSIFTLNFFQTERIEGKILPCYVKVYLIDLDEQLISNEEIIIGDKTSSNPEERNINIKFVLKPMDYDRNKDYYLIIKDEDTGIIYDKVQFKISLGIVSDFDF